MMLIAAMLIATARFSAAASLRLADWRLEIDMSQPPITFWNATTDGCYKGDAIDETLTAFRTTGGQIRMVGGNGGLGPISFAGTSLLTLKRDCATGPVINSRNNYSGPADFPHNMWLPATYAMEDGMTVHGLVHDEFHAARESVPPEWCINTTVDNHTKCSGWASTVISVISTDGGKSFRCVTSDERPHGIAIGAPIPYRPNWKNNPGLQGMPAHRSMVRSPKDGFWYTMPTCAYLTQLGKQRGKCVFRTANVSDPASWVGWNGSAWSVPGAVDPYVTPVPPADMAKYTAAPVNANGAGLTYLTSAQAFVLIGTSKNSSQGGFAYQLSEDLVTWTEPRLMGGQGNGAKGTEEEIMYPTMLDHTDTSQNFERFGETGHVFYSTDGRPPKAVARRPVRVVHIGDSDPDS
jgi:hypothetical protein